MLIFEFEFNWSDKYHTLIGHVICIFRNHTRSSQGKNRDYFFLLLFATASNKLNRYVVPVFECEPCSFEVKVSKFVIGLSNRPIRNVEIQST